METIDIIKVIISVVAGYAILFFAMWIFGRKRKIPTIEKKVDKK